MNLDQQRVLIVEDEMLVALDIVCAVEDAGGIALAPANRVQDALLAIESGAVTAAILDLNVRDGETTPVALALAGRQIPFIVFTGGGLPPRLRTQFGDAPVHIKPISTDRLLAALSCEIAKHSARRAPVGFEESRKAKRHALVIEDEEVMAFLLESLVRTCGYASVDRADTEERAMAAARAHKPDLIVADVRIVGGSGLAAARAIRIAYGVPMVVVTAWPEQARGVPAHCLVAKPFDPRTLQAAIKGADLGDFVNP